MLLPTATSRRAFPLSVLFVTVLLPAISQAEIVLTQRESRGGMDVFAGAGGAVDSRDSSNNKMDLTGSLAYADGHIAEVTESDRFSTGAANARVDISVTDNVTQSSPDLIVLTANRNSTSITQYGSGTGLANTTARHEFRVRFNVTDTPVRYNMSGTFDPGITSGIVGEVGSLRLYRPFTSNEFFDIRTAGAVNETGILREGRTYEFRLWITDRLSASASKPGPFTDISSANINISFASVPEPNLLFTCLLGTLFCISRRNRKF